MSPPSCTPAKQRFGYSEWWLLLAAFILTAAVYSTGLTGGYLFDDFPNIVQNSGVQPHDASLSSIVRAALSSPSSEFKRPLASLSFAVNYLATGLDPYWMKLTNLVIHLVNGGLIFLLTRQLIAASTNDSLKSWRTSYVAVLVACCWMLLPINLTAVLYVVQRMESMANLFVLTGLIMYVSGRRRMVSPAGGPPADQGAPDLGSRGMMLCVSGITIPTIVGLLAKETAVMLPLYAVLVEWIMFGFSNYNAESLDVLPRGRRDLKDRRIIGLFVVVLLLPMVAGLCWILPGVLRPEAWATRDFSLTTRLLSEMRIVVDYLDWTVLPAPSSLSFYHDDFAVSTGLTAPWSTLFCMLFLMAIIMAIPWLRRRQPMIALGLAWFLGCQLLTGTIIPLELIYEHRNYFASYGLMLAIVPVLAAPGGGCFVLPRRTLLAGLFLCWTALTAVTAYAWGEPLRLAIDLASRAPMSPRAQYELGRTYIIRSHYDPLSPFTQLAYAPLERSAGLPDSSILPEQALIFMNSRMRLPLKRSWWESMIRKLKAHAPGVQDESSLAALAQCQREGNCILPKDRMNAAFEAALDHPDPSARLLAIYADYAWNTLSEPELALHLMQEAIKRAPVEPAYQITLVRMLVAQQRIPEANKALTRLETLNIGGILDQQLSNLRKLPGLR